MGRQIENRPKSNYKNTKYGESPLLCRLGLHSASSVQRDEAFFKLDQEAPFRESPLLPVLDGGITVASLSVRRVDVEGGYTRLHVSGAGPSQQVVLVGSHRAARTLGTISCSISLSGALTLSLIGHHHGHLGGLFNDNIKATLTRGRLPRLLQAKKIRSWLEWRFLLLVSSRFLRVFLASLRCSLSRARASNLISFWSESLSSWRSLREISISWQFSWATLEVTSPRVMSESLGIKKYSRRGLIS